MYSVVFYPGGGSANKTFLYQQTKALLNPEKLLSFVNEKIKVCALKLLTGSCMSSNIVNHVSVSTVSHKRLEHCIR